MIGVGDYKTNMEIQENIAQVLASGRLTYGPFTKQAEEEWAKIHNARYAIAVSSGTAALHVGLLALKEKYGWTENNEIILPATTFVASLNTVHYAGLRPRLVDVLMDDALIDPEAVRQAINKNTVAVMPVHLFGKSAPMDKIMAIAKAANLSIIEDSCEAVLATSQQRTVGSMGEVAAFSTYVAHHIPAGNGGFLVTSDAQINDIARSLVNHGRDTAYFQPDMRKPGMSDIQFLFHRPGLNYRSTELTSAVVCGLLYAGADGIIQWRNKLADRYCEGLAPLVDTYLLEHTSGRSGEIHSWMMFPILAEWCETREDKFAFMEFLWKHGIDSREALPLVNQPYLSSWILDPEKEFPVASYWNRCGLYLPCHQYMLPREVDHVVTTIGKYLSVLSDSAKRPGKRKAGP